jgi:hypothetical protein
VSEGHKLIKKMKRLLHSTPVKDANKLSVNESKTYGLHFTSNRNDVKIKGGKYLANVMGLCQS